MLVATDYAYQLLILISMRYDFQPRCLLRKVMEATEALSGIGWIETISGRVAISVLPPLYNKY